MKSIELTRRETDELAQALKIAEETIRRINAIQVFNTSTEEIWELKNFSSQISAILYNISEGVYLPSGVRS